MRRWVVRYRRSTSVRSGRGAASARTGMRPGPDARPAPCGSCCPCAVTASRRRAGTAYGIGRDVRSQRKALNAIIPGVLLPQRPRDDHMTALKKPSGQPTGNGRHFRGKHVSPGVFCHYGLPNRTSVRINAESGSNRDNNVPWPRVHVNAAITRIGVGRRARVDPWGDPRAHTAGPTCHPQRVRAQRAPSRGWTRESRRHTPPWRARNWARGVSATNRPTVEICPRS